jgi:hypothetical protein
VVSIIDCEDELADGKDGASSLRVVIYVSETELAHLLTKGAI